MALVQRIKSSSDKKYMIPSSLTHSTGTITASFPTNTMVGGSYSVVLSGLTAHTNYFLYIRNSGITPSLFFSTTTPAAYRVSFPDAILVGAFLSSETPGFGAFLNIEGVPRTQNQMRWTPSGASGFGTIGSPEMNFTRDGRWLVVDFRFTTGTVSGSTAFITIPSGLVWDSAWWQQTTYNLGTMTNNSAVNFVHMFAASSNADRIFFNTSTGALGSAMLGNASPFASGQIESGMFRLPISGWSTTPLKDL